MTKITVNSEPYLTGRGLFGAVLFVLGPIAGGFAYTGYVGAIAENSWRSSPVPWAIVMVVAGLCSLIGFVLLFAGRAHTHVVQVGPDDAPSRQPPSTRGFD